MKNKTKYKFNIKKTMVLMMLVCFVSVIPLSFISLASCEFPYDFNVADKTSFVGHTNSPAISSIIQQFSLDTPQICDNMTILMRNTGVAPNALFSMNIYTYNTDYVKTQDYGGDISPKGEFIASSTNYFDNSNFKNIGTTTNSFDIETWNLTTFKFDSISLNASTFYVFEVNYIGSGVQTNVGDWSNIGHNCTDLALINVDDGGYQYWRYIPHSTEFGDDYYYNTDNIYNLAIPWIMNQERIVSTEGVTFTFEPFSHGRVFYKVSGGNQFPPTGTGVDVNNNGESINLGIGGYVFLYAVADEGYYFSGMNVTGIGENLLSGYCVSKEESRTISVSFIELPEGLPNGYTLVIASDKGAGVNYFVDDDISYIEPSLWEGTTNYVRLSNVPFNSLVYVYAVNENSYSFQHWSLSMNEVIEGVNSHFSGIISYNPFIFPEGSAISFYDNGTIAYYVTYVSISLDADWVGAGTPPPEPTMGTDATPTPTPTLNPNAQRTFAILDFLFGNNGILGAGFGLLVIVVSILPCIIFAPFRNLWGFLGFFNVGVIITLATELLPIWVLILLVLLDIAVILRNRLSGGNGEE